MAIIFLLLGIDSTKVIVLLLYKFDNSLLIALSHSLTCLPLIALLYIFLEFHILKILFNTKLNKKIQ